MVDINVLRKEYERYNHSIMDHTVSNMVGRDISSTIIYPELDKSIEDNIKHALLFGDYPKKLKPLVKKLLEYTDISNLMICFNNLQTVSLERDTALLPTYTIYRDNSNLFVYHSF